MKAIGGQRFGSYDVGKMKAALRIAKEAGAEVSAPKDTATISGGKNEPAPLDRDGLQTIHQNIKPTGKDLPNHQAGWVGRSALTWYSGDASAATPDILQLVPALALETFETTALPTPEKRGFGVD